ncbi:MAG TPA: MerR family DNA-binding protein, partial [Mycobacteriales bacterium]
RLAFVQAGRQLGLSLEDIGSALAGLPQGRTPTARDWAEVSHRWGRQIDVRIAELQLMRETLDGCIGCGCLSLRKCGLFNHGDKAATKGPGARWLLGDHSEETPDR